MALVSTWVLQVAPLQDWGQVLQLASVQPPKQWQYVLVESGDHAQLAPFKHVAAQNACCTVPQLPPSANLGKLLFLPTTN